MLWLFITIIVTILILTGYLSWHFQSLPLLVKYVPRKWLRWLGGAVIAGIFFVAAFIFRTWLIALFLYVCIGYFLCDMTGLILRRTRHREKWQRFPVNHFAWIFGLLICLLGYYNARNLVLTEYTVEINKPIKPLRIVFISDTHIGAAFRANELVKTQKMVEELSPDLILLGGDIYDEGTSEDEKAHSYGVWKSMAARLGKYYVTGNHEFSSHGPGINIDEIMAELEKSDVRVLLDKTVLIDNEFYLIGRRDQAKPREELEVLTAGIDKSKPVILLDHQPIDREKARELGVDLQLSGHTHNGQLFPFKWLLLTVYGVTSGQYQWGDYHLVISTGAGTWRLPIRTSGRSEILLINLQSAR